MYKYAGRILDQQDETGQMLDDLSDNAFALPEARRYPVNSIESINKSAEWLEKTAGLLSDDDLEVVRTNLVKAASWFNIDLIVPEPRMQKVAEAREQTVKEAMDEFEEKHHRIDWELKREIATELRKEAEAEKIDLTPMIAEYSGDSLHEKIAENIMARKGVTSDENGQKAIAAFALRKNIESPNALMRALAKLDDLLGLRGFYGKNIKDPALTIVGPSSKLKKTPTVSLDGQTILLDDLAALNFNNLFDPVTAMKYKLKPETLKEADPTVQAMVVKEL